MDVKNSEVYHTILQNQDHCLKAEPRILESLAGCSTMFLFAGFCKTGALERNAIDFISN